MKKIIVAAACSLGVLCASAQTENSPTKLANTTFFAEVFGPGVLFSANIDTRFTKSRLGFGGRAGLGFVTGSVYIGGITNGSSTYPVYEDRSVLTVPVQLNYLFGKADNPHMFEVGAGATYLGQRIDFFNFNRNEPPKLLGTASFMYRRVPVDGGFTWRIGFTPFIAGGYIQPSGGVSIGYAF